ncbi:MAG: hypothetical protein HOJ97_04275, partial [Alphaproteobacteria bacterium]|nr:hypothetical protein [Alphaproteobacteria bacterium]
GAEFNMDEIGERIIEPLNQVQYLDDSLITGAYRRRLLKGLLLRAIEQAANRA